MFPLSRQASVFCDDGPTIAHFFDVPLAGIDHGLDGESHADFEFIQGARFSIMQNLRFLVKDTANAMTTKFSNNGEA